MKSKNGIKTIIVGVDFSKYSADVALQARAVARSLDVPLVFVHIYADPVVADWRAAEILSQLTNFYRKQVTTRYSVGSNESVVVKYGAAYRQIIAIAKKYPQPIIFVGHRGGRSAVSKFFLGSTAERLALRSPFPVWVHRGHKVKLPKKILVPCDFTKRSKNAIEGAKKIIRLNGVRFELFHVLQPPVPVLDYQYWQVLNTEVHKANKKELTKFKKKFAPIKIVEINSNDVSGEIEKRSKNFDLVAISPNEREGTFSSFGSVTSKVVKSGNTSVLVIP